MTDPAATHLGQSRSFTKCAGCGSLLIQGDPKIRAYGLVFCSDDCCDQWELDDASGYAEDPLGGSWS